MKRILLFVVLDLLATVIAVSVNHRSPRLVDDGLELIENVPAFIGMRDEVLDAGVLAGPGEAKEYLAKPDEGGQESLLDVSASLPTEEYLFDGINNSADAYFCRHLSSAISTSTQTAYRTALGVELGTGPRAKVSKCSLVRASEADHDQCNNSYAVGEEYSGKFLLCGFNMTTKICTNVTTHHCAWTWLVEDMIARHATDYKYCIAQLMDSKRSQNALTNEINSLINLINAEEQIIRAQNKTIRDAITERKNHWDQYQLDQLTCVRNKDATDARLVELDAELDQLEALANPEVRSAVDFDETAGYQHVSLVETGEDGPASLNGSQGEAATSLVETQAGMDMVACQQFRSFMERMKTVHGVTMKAASDPAISSCNASADFLNRSFTEGYLAIANLKQARMQLISDTYTTCLSNATYNYYYATQGPGGTESDISDAVELIYSSQQRIAELTPRQHDAEHAVVRIRMYLDELNTTCTLDQDAVDEMQNLLNLIKQLQDCPGLHNFTLIVPVWAQTWDAHSSLGTVNTPPPTPWQNRYDGDDQ